MSEENATKFLHENGNTTYTCSWCKREFEEASDMYGSSGLFPWMWDFCPNCGREIEVEESK